MALTIRDKLLRTRQGFEVERNWHRFLIDAYQGTGGFEGRIKRPDSELGSAASCYGCGCGDVSYLDRYHREDEEKFKSRLLVAHYLNYVGALTELKVNFMLRKGFDIDGLPDELVSWRSNVDGDGNSMERMRKRVATWAAVLGWVPTPVDMPQLPDGLLTRAQAGEVAPRVTLMYPANLTDWALDGPDFKWAKLQADYSELETWDADDVRRYSRITIWTPSGWELWEVDQDETRSAVRVGDGTHPFRRVPIPVCRHKEAEGAPVFGLPMHGDVALEARRLFNLCSEFDETLRAHGFPTLVLAEEIGEPSDEPDGGDDRTVGTKNALLLDQNASQKHYYLEMSGAIAEAFETRIENTIREIYRMARVSYERPSGNEESGIARKHAFAATNAAIADFAGNLAMWERDVYILAGRGLGLSEEKLQRIRVVAPTDFDVEDLDSEMRRLLDSLNARLGPTAEKIIRMHIARRVIPDMSPEIEERIVEDLERQAVEDQAFDAFRRSGSFSDDSQPQDDNEDDV